VTNVGNGALRGCQHQLLLVPDADYDANTAILFGDRETNRPEHQPGQPPESVTYGAGDDSNKRQPAKREPVLPTGESYFKHLKEQLEQTQRLRSSTNI